MSGGVPAGEVAAIVSLLGDIAMWSGNQKLIEQAFALSQQIATPTPPSRDADVERVARSLSENLYAFGNEDNSDCGEWEDMSDGAREVYRIAARAALQALGERG